VVVVVDSLGCSLICRTAQYELSLIFNINGSSFAGFVSKEKLYDELS
jgi:hypothetical protein